MTLHAGLVVVAAGTGHRLGATVHKALVPLAGRPLVERTVRHLLTVTELGPVVVVGHPADREAHQRWIAELPRPVHLVDGGARRQDSVLAGVRALGTPAPDVVLVHDGARPFPPREAILPLIEAARDGASLLASRVTDTLKAARSSGAAPQVDRTVPRDGLWSAQTPQAFPTRELIERLEEAGRQGITVTDEAGLFETAGRRVTLVEGSRLNIKVTTPEDLTLAEAILRGRGDEERGAR